MLLASVVFYYNMTAWRLNMLGREALLIIVVGISTK